MLKHNIKNDEQNNMQTANHDLGTRRQYTPPQELRNATKIA